VVDRGRPGQRRTAKLLIYLAASRFPWTSWDATRLSNGPGSIESLSLGRTSAGFWRFGVSKLPPKLPQGAPGRAKSWTHTRLCRCS
jgi:hypothetical protein